MDILTDIGDRILHGWVYAASLLVLAQVVQLVVTETRAKSEGAVMGSIALVSILLAVAWFLGGTA